MPRSRWYPSSERGKPLSPTAGCPDSPIAGNAIVTMASAAILTTPADPRLKMPITVPPRAAERRSARHRTLHGIGRRHTQGVKPASPSRMPSIDDVAMFDLPAPTPLA